MSMKEISPEEQMKRERAAQILRPLGYSQEELDAFAAQREPLKFYHWTELVLELERRGLKVKVSE